MIFIVRQEEKINGRFIWLSLKDDSPKEAAQQYIISIENFDERYGNILVWFDGANVNNAEPIEFTIEELIV